MTSREAFEAWFKPTFYDDCAWSESRNCYVEPSVHMAWKGWQAAIQHACDVALAPKAGFVMVPRDGVEQIADALADVLATFQHAEPEALKAAIRHSNKSAHAAYTLVYGLLFAAQPGAQESAK